MLDKAESRIYRLSGVCAMLAAACLILPRFAANPEGGFAGAATAVLTLLLILAATFLFSLYLLVISIQHYRTLSLGARIAGIGPSVVLAVVLITLVTLLRY